MSQTITLRISDEDAAEVRRIAQRERRSINDVGTRIIDEWLRLNRFPLIEFRSINGERVACIKGALEIWQALKVLRIYDGDVNKAAAHLSLNPHQIESALQYYEDYPEEIDLAITESSRGYDRLKTLLPHIKLENITDEELENIKLARQ